MITSFARARRACVVAGACLVLGSFGCWLGLFYKEKLTAGYELVAVDVMEQMAIAREQRWVVKATVFAVGWDDRFIIAKRHPPKSALTPDRTVTTYHLIDTASDWVGEFPDAEAFARARRSLGVPEELGFQRVFRALE
jgi:hypothetical protein